jgi:hypothetical protein
MSTELRMFSAEQVRSVARQLVALEPALRTVPAEQIVAQQGWTLCDDKGYRRMVHADLGLGIAECMVYLHLADDGTAYSISVAVCDNAPRPITPEAKAVVRDAFTVAARALTDEYGAPHSSVPGDEAVMVWRLDPATLVLSLGWTTTRLAVWRTSEYDERVERAANER